MAIAYAVLVGAAVPKAHAVPSAGECGADAASASTLLTEGVLRLEGAGKGEGESAGRALYPQAEARAGMAVVYRSVLEDAMRGTGAFKELFDEETTGRYAVSSKYWESGGYTLHDADGDGTMELFVHVNASYMASYACFAFTIEDGQARCLGRFGDRGAGLWVGKRGGLFLEVTQMGLACVEVVVDDEVHLDDVFYEPRWPLEMSDDYHAFVAENKPGADLPYAAANDYSLLEAYASGEPMFRLYNPYTGEHFYTDGIFERSEVVHAGWDYEKVGWTAPTTSGTPVFRLYNPYAGEHHYTPDAVEKETLTAAGWIDEGVGWYSDDAKTVPLYREYNPNEPANNHNYTTSKEEHDGLVALGWVDEGIAWYGV